MLLKPLNFLILDEPTHHLDIQSKDVLKEALKNYEGAFLLVSHDRDFLTGLTTRLLELDDHRIRDQHMDILELIEKRKALQGADIGKSSTAQAKVPKSEKNTDQRDKRDREKERRKAQNAVERLEKQLAELEKEEKQLQAEVMKGGLANDALQKGYERLGQLAQDIAKVMEQWEGASAELQGLSEEM
jgi:ATP-binding cassette subfamily F protein 3